MEPQLPLPGDASGDTPAPIQGDSLIALLDQLQDIATPPPVPLTPQTWAWAAVAAALLAALALAAVAWTRHRRATAWRRAALAELAALTPALAADDPAALAQLETLLRRVALATAPRSEIAPLTGPAWADHLTQTGFGPLAAALAQSPYQPHPRDGTAAAAAARAWIRRHA